MMHSYDHLLLVGSAVILGSMMLWNIVMSLRNIRKQRELEEREAQHRRRMAELEGTPRRRSGKTMHPLP